MAVRLAAAVGLVTFCTYAAPLRAAPFDADNEGGQRSYSQHAFTKIRAGSLLASDTVVVADTEVRSNLEKRRDAELLRHYERLARLDVIAEMCGTQDHVQERCDQLRRSETQRFYLAMQSYRLAAWQKKGAGLP